MQAWFYVMYWTACPPLYLVHVKYVLKKSRLEKGLEKTWSENLQCLHVGEQSKKKKKKRIVSESKLKLQSLDINTRLVFATHKKEAHMV